MPLEDLYQTIEKLRERIKNHESKLSISEALTRNTLIDPLLRALGWDTEDPNLVFPEYKLGKGKADYALLSRDKTIIVIESKKLGAPLDDATIQAITYCIQDGIQYCAVTDGRQWDLYETLKAAPIADKKIVHFDVLEDFLSDVCLNALALWRRSAQEGVVRPGQTPLLEPQDPPPDPDQATKAGSSTPGIWQTLAQLQTVPEGKLPLEIRFPDKATKKIGVWSDIPRDVVTWLRQQGKLDETVIPIQSDGSYILSYHPVHLDGKKFKGHHKIGKFYTETKNGKVISVKNANTIVEKAGKGVSADQFSVRLPE